MNSKEETMEGFESKVKEIKEFIEKDDLQSLLILNGSKSEYGSMFCGAPIDMIKLLSQTMESDKHLDFCVRAAIISLDGIRAKEPPSVVAKRMEKLFEEMKIYNKSNETAGKAACEPPETAGKAACEPLETAGKAACEPLETAGKAACEPLETAGKAACEPLKDEKEKADEDK